MFLFMYTLYYKYRKFKFYRYFSTLIFPAVFLHYFFPPYLNIIFSGVLEVSGEDTKYKMLMRGNEHPWYENIKITCKECDNQFWLGQFMKHIILNHKMPIKVSGLFRVSFKVQLVVPISIVHLIFLILLRLKFLIYDFLLCLFNSKREGKIQLPVLFSVSDRFLFFDWILYISPF